MKRFLKTLLSLQFYDIILHIWLLYIFTNQSFRKIVCIYQYSYRIIYHYFYGVFVVVYTQVFIPWTTVVYA